MTKLKDVHSTLPISLFIGLFCSTLIFSCSHSKHEAYKTPPRPSLKAWQDEDPDTDSEEEFLEIEKSRATEQYRKQREWARKNPKKFRQKRLRLYREAREKARKKRESKQSEQPRQTQTPPKEESSSPPPLTEDEKIELHQNIRYYCIQNEGQTRWDEIENCVSFGKSRVENCREKTNSASSQELIKCLKAKLK